MTLCLKTTYNDGMNIIIADDHDLVRDAIASLITRDDNQTQTFLASDFQQAMDLLAQNNDIDIILLDVNMPGMANLESVKTVVEHYPNIPVAMISGVIKKAEVELSFEYGAKGFIPKTMNGKALLSVLKMIINGTRYVPEIYLEKQAAPQKSKKQDVLSQRERDVLNELFKGQSNKQIAKKLFIEETTVKLHLRSLFTKLNAHNRTEVVIKAIQKGLNT